MFKLWRRGVFHFLVLILPMTSLCGCAHTNHPWGESTTPLPGWRAYGEAAKNAIADPHTWVPLIAGGFFHSTGLDDNLTDWAVDQDLMFHSTEAANRYSDDWLDATEWLVYATALGTPSGNEPTEWLINKAKGLSATALILKSSYTIASTAKKPFNRERPDKTNKESFPSSHALRASMRATMTARNIEAMPLRSDVKLALQGGVYTLAGMVCWSRLEANAHYPSDVLIGYSLGHFFGAFLNDAFITPHLHERVRLQTGIYQDGWQLSLSGHFN